MMRGCWRSDRAWPDDSDCADDEAGTSILLAYFDHAPQFRIELRLLLTGMGRDAGFIWFAVN